MKRVKILGRDVVVRNEREMCFVYAVESELRRFKRCVEAGNFSSAEMYGDTICEHFSCMFFLHMVKTPRLFSEDELRELVQSGVPILQEVN